LCGFSLGLLRKTCVFSRSQREKNTGPGLLLSDRLDFGLESAGGFLSYYAKQQGMSVIVDSIQ
jgi:hypothetical protein